MPISTRLAYDAIHTSINALPPGQHCGYTTGSGGICWTAADWAAHPGAVRIDQDAYARDTTADILDVENGAATPADCPSWVKNARTSYRSDTRAGQRSPAIYTNGSNLSAVCNSLVAGGVTSGVGIWLANWSLNASAAAAQVVAGSGPFPVIAVQFSDAGLYDISVFSTTWLDTMSGGAESVISAGSSGPAVVLAQNRLNVWGAASPPLVADGEFGPATTAAAVTFQRIHGLVPDGVVGPLTWNALSANPVPPPSPPEPVSYSVTVPPPGTWKTGGVLTVTGTGPDGGTWKTASPDGKTWTAPVKS